MTKARERDETVADFLNLSNLMALTTLTLLEIILGVDNIVVIAIVTSRLPQKQQSLARRLGLALAMGQRIILLACLSWLAHLTDVLFSVKGIDFSGRSLVLLIGGLFLVAKATHEIHAATEGDDEHGSKSRKTARLLPTLVQITLLDIVFSLDSVITAVGMVDQLGIMILAIILAVFMMMVYANTVSNFILQHPTVKMLALSFLLLIGFVLIADGLGRHIEKGYIYFAMAFAVMVEVLNFRLRSR